MINSGASGCGKASAAPGFNTDVSYHVNWIKSVIQDENISNPGSPTVSVGVNSSPRRGGISSNLGPNSPNSGGGIVFANSGGGFGQNFG